MKQLKNLTLYQKKLLESLGLSPKEWKLERNTEEYLVFVNIENGDMRRFLK